MPNGNPLTGRVRVLVRGSSDDMTSQVVEVAERLVARGFDPSTQMTVVFDTKADDRADRDVVRRLLDDADAGRFEHLIVPGLDRLSRDAVELSRILLGLDDAGVHVVSLEEAFCADAALVPVLFPLSSDTENLS